MNQTLHDTGNPERPDTEKAQVETAGKPRKSKRKPKRGLREELHVETRELRAEMLAGFDRLDQRIVYVESGLRADMASMEDGLRTDISGNLCLNLVVVEVH